MSKRGKQFVTFLLCAAVVSNFGCTTTTHRVKPSQAAMDNYGLEKGDMVLVHYANINDAKSSSKSEQIRITDIGNNGISGTSEVGAAVTIDYDNIFQIEYSKKENAIKRDSPVLMFLVCTPALLVGGPCG